MSNLKAIVKLELASVDVGLVKEPPIVAHVEGEVASLGDLKTKVKKELVGRLVKANDGEVGLAEGLLVEAGSIAC